MPSRYPLPLAPAQAQRTGKRKRSLTKQEERRQRAQLLGVVRTPPAVERRLTEALEAAGRETSAARAAAARSEEARRRAVEAGADDLHRLWQARQELMATETVAITALNGLERAMEQRTEMYYQAKHSNSLAAMTIEQALSGGQSQDNSRMEQRKVEVVEQAASLRRATLKHVAAAQGHRPIPLPQELRVTGPFRSHRS